MHHFLLRVCLLLPLFSSAQVVKKPFVVTLLVTDSVSGKPLQDAAVSIDQHDHTHLTLQNGEVVFELPESGTYRVSCSMMGYHGQQMSIYVQQRRQRFEVKLCPATYHLHDVVVEEVHSKQSDVFTRQSRSVLNEQQIEKMRGQTLGALLSNVNGVTTLSTGPGIAKPVVRGLHSNRLALISDGMKLESQQWGSEHAPEIDPFSVNRVEVVKGASSVEFGPEALGGAIRLTPKPYRAEPGIEGAVSLNGFSNNRQGAASAMFQGAHFQQHRINWRLQTSLRKAGDSRAPDYVISNTGVTEIAYSGAVQYRFKKLQVELMASEFNSTIGIMRAAHIGSSTDLLRAISADQPSFIAPFTYAIDAPRQEVNHLVQQGRLSYQFSPNVLLWLQVNKQINRRLEYDRGVSWNPQSVSRTRPAYDLTLTTWSYDGTLEWKQHDQWKAKFGLNFVDQSNYTAGIQKPIIPNFIAYTYGVYAIEKWQRGRWNAEAGIRYDRREQDVYFRNQLNLIEQRSQSFQRGTAIGGVGYSINEKWKVGATFSGGWRPPAVNELYSSGLHNGTATYEIGDTTLVPEQSYQLDVNTRYQSGAFTLDMSLYHQSIEDFMYLKPVLTPTVTLRGSFPTFMFTQTNVRIMGLEMQGSWAIHSRLTASAMLSFLHADDVSNKEPLIQMPANRMRLAINYHREHLWKLEHVFAEVAWLGVDRQRRVPEGRDYLEPPNAYQLWDLQIGAEWPVAKQHIRFSLGVQNMLNTSYRDYLNRFRYFTNEPGRNIVIRVFIPFQLLTTTKKQ